MRVLHIHLLKERRKTMAWDTGLLSGRSRTDTLLFLLSEHTDTDIWCKPPPLIAPAPECWFWLTSCQSKSAASVLNARRSPWGCLWAIRDPQLSRAQSGPGADYSCWPRRLGWAPGPRPATHTHTSLNSYHNHASSTNCPDKEVAIFRDSRRDEEHTFPQIVCWNTTNRVWPPGCLLKKSSSAWPFRLSVERRCVITQSLSAIYSIPRRGSGINTHIWWMVYFSYLCTEALNKRRDVHEVVILESRGIIPARCEGENKSALGISPCQTFTSRASRASLQHIGWERSRNISLTRLGTKSSHIYARRRIFISAITQHETKLQRKTVSDFFFFFSLTTNKINQINNPVRSSPGCLLVAEQRGPLLGHQLDDSSLLLWKREKGLVQGGDQRPLQQHVLFSVSLRSTHSSPRLQQEKCQTSGLCTL